MHRHHSLISILRDASSWAGFAGVMTTLATQLHEPFSIICYGLAGMCSIVAIMLKTPLEPRK